MVKPVIEILRAYIKDINAWGTLMAKPPLPGAALSEGAQIEGHQMPSKTIKRLFRLLYYIMKIRGYKTVGEYAYHH
jgi:hypothetical protein